MREHAVLDPASLYVKIDYDFYVRALGTEDAGVLIDAILQGDTPAIAAHCKSLSDPARRGRAGFLATTYWHEQRHFLDYVLTNWGMSDHRFFLQWLKFLPFLISTLQKENLPLPIPLDVCLNAGHLRMLKIKAEYPLQIKEFAEHMLSHGDSRVDDGHAIQRHGRSGRLGGRAQLECLATLAQAGMAQEWLGLDPRSDINAFGERLRISFDRADGVLSYLQEQGLLDCETIEGRIVSLKNALPIALLTASLCCRRKIGPDTSDPRMQAAYWPIHRLIALAEVLRGLGPDLNSALPAIVWDTINQACRKLWGRTPAQEVEADIDWMEERLSDLSSRRAAEVQVDPIGATLFEIGKDLVALRRSMLDRLRRESHSFIDMHSYARSLGQDLRPRVLACAPYGHLDFESGRFIPIHIAHVDHLGEYWWSAISSKWETQGRLALPDSEAWRVVCRDFSPAARFLVRGRMDYDNEINTPELASAEHAFRHDAKLEVAIAPECAGPQTERAAGHYFRFVAGPLRCDVCGGELHEADTIALRRHDLMTAPDARSVRDRLLALRRPWDWSDWLIHERHLHEHRPDEAGGK